MTTSETNAARVELLAVADDLQLVLYRLNRYGDYVNRRIATQADGCAYGEVHDGLRALLEEMFSFADAGKILTLVFNDEMRPSDAAALIANTNMKEDSP